MASLERDRILSARPVSTGYADLDRLLYGGLPPNLAVALTSPACNERDLLVKDFLETGARKGEVTFYATTDPGAVKHLAEEFRSNFYLFVCNPQADAIVREAPNVFKLKGVENLTDISIALTSTIRKLEPSSKGASRICLNLVSDVLLQHNAVQTRRWLTSLVAELKSAAFTILAVFDPEMHSSQDARAILDLFDGEINIREKETEKGLERYLRVRKMSNEKYLEDELPLKREEPEARPQESTTGLGVLDKHRIAVLPFVNMSPDPNDEYFADGMTEEIISTVSGISGLDVISRTSVMGYKGTAKKVKEIGRELEVGSVLEGSFRKAGNRIRVTTQLIDVAADRHLWAQNYDRNLDDIFAVQSDVAKQVAEALRVRILALEKDRIEKKPTESTEAYTLYLKGRYVWNKRGGETGIEDVKQAAKCFEQAVRDDPGFALGYVGQADCCLILRSGLGVNTDFENVGRAKSLVTKALELDPELAEAHATMGSILSDEYNLRQAEDEFKKAIALKPSYAIARCWYQLKVLRPELRWEEALEQIEKALELDPLSPVVNINLGVFYASRKEYARAVEPYKRAIDLGNLWGHIHLAAVYGRMRMFDEMRREYAIYFDLFQGSYPHLRTGIDADIAVLEDDTQALRRLLPDLEAHLQDGSTGWDAYGIAGAYFHLGENEKGFEWLERSYSRKEDSLLYIQVSAYFDNVRTDPRYLDLLKRLGLDQIARQT